MRQPEKVPGHSAIGGLAVYLFGANNTDRLNRYVVFG